MKQKLIIFEGIASSGKTTLVNQLKEKLTPNFSVRVILETETLMPLIDNKSPDIASDFLREYIDKTLKSFPEEVLIIDRFHLTHAFRTNSTLVDFQEIENKLEGSYDPSIVLLTINDDLIQQRIAKTAELRGGAWAQGKQGTLEEKTVYYKEQQIILKKRIEESKIKHIQLNASGMDWDHLADTLYEFILK